MGSGVRGVDLSLYLPIHDTPRTFRLSGPRAQVQPEHALLAHAVQCVGDLVTLATAFMMTVNGFVEVVSRAMLREQTISKPFSGEGDAEQIVGRERRGRVSELAWCG
jgi:hypothetical protein